MHAGRLSLSSLSCASLYDLLVLQLEHNGYDIDEKLMHWYMRETPVVFEPGVLLCLQHNMQASGWCICVRMGGVLQ